MSDNEARDLRRSFLRSQYTETFWSLLLKGIDDKANEIFEAIKGVSFSDKKGEYWSEFEKILKTGTETKFLPYSSPHISMLLCVDESKFLSNLFPDSCKWSLLSHIHHAARYVPQGFALVFMDTLADLNILLGNTLKSTIPNKIGHKEFVFSDLTNFDLGHLNSNGITNSLGTMNSADFICGFGRPSWNAGRKCKGAWGALVEEAATRLLSCQNIGEYKRGAKLTIPAATAIMANRVNIDINAALNTGAELVSSHMAYVNYFPHDGRAACIGYPSDPVLSHAARYLLTGMDLWVPCLEKIGQSIKSGLVHKGERGELAAQLVICYILDKLSKESLCKYLNIDGAPAKCVPVEDFLREFDPAQARKLPEELKGALINLTHFIKVVDYTPNRCDLVRFICRGAGVVLRDGCPGADLVIPLILKKPCVKSPDPPEPTVFACLRPADDNLFELISKSVEIPTSMEQTTSRYEAGLVNISVKEKDAFIIYNEQSQDTATAGSNSSAPKEKEKTTDEDKYLWGSDNVSYIFIQVKNLRAQSDWPSDLPNLNPYSIGIDSLENFKCNRPYIAMGIQFTQDRLLARSTSKIREMNVPAAPPIKESRKRTSSKAATSSHILSFRVINPHYSFSATDGYASISIRDAFDIIVNAAPQSLEDIKKLWPLLAYCKMQIAPLRHTSMAELVAALSNIDQAQGKRTKSKSKPKKEKEKDSTSETTSSSSSSSSSSPMAASSSRGTRSGASSRSKQLINEDNHGQDADSDVAGSLHKKLRISDQ